MLNQRKKLFKNIASLGVVQIANYVFPLISIPIISRIIGPEKLGVINYSSAFMTYFVLVVSFGFDLTATRRISVDSSNQSLINTVFSEVLFAKILLSIFSLVLFIPCLFLVPPLHKEITVAIFSFILCFASIFNQNWLFQALQELSKVAILNFVSKLLFTFCVILIVRNEQDYIWQPLLTSVIQIGVAILSFFWAINRYKIQIYKIPFKQVLNLLWSGKVVFFSMVVISLYTTTNTVILGLFRPAYEVGYYTAALKLIEVANSVINLPLSQALYPFIAVAFSESREKGILIVQKMVPIIVLFTIMVALGLFIFGSLLLTFFYGEKFKASILIFQLLSIVPSVIALSNVFGIQVMLNLKMDKIFFSITSIGAVLGLFLNLIMVNLWGGVGTAINWLIVEFYITGAMYYVLKRKGISLINLSYFKLDVLASQIKPVTDKLSFKK